MLTSSFVPNEAIKSFSVNFMFLLIDAILETTHITIIYEKNHSCFNRQKLKCSWFIGSFKRTGIWTTCTSKSNAVLRCAALKYSCWSRQILEPTPAYESAVLWKKIYFRCQFLLSLENCCLDRLNFKAEHRSAAFPFEAQLIQIVDFLSLLFFF